MAIRYQVSMDFFKNFTPNQRNGIYYTNYREEVLPELAGSKTSDYWGVGYLAYIKKINEGNYYTLPIQSFNFYDNYVDINYNGIIGKQWPLFADFITYIAVTIKRQQVENDPPWSVLDTYNAKYKFYHVTKVEIYLDKARLYITPDEWANYIGYAKISRVKVGRTNQNLFKWNDELYTTDLHNPYASAIPSYTYAFKNPRHTRADLRIYAAIQYKTLQTFNKSLDEISMFMFNPADILGKTAAALTQKDIINACNLVGSIYSTGTGSAREAAIVRLYLFDTTLQQLGVGVQIFTGIEANGNTKEIEGYLLEDSFTNQFSIFISNGTLGFTPKQADKIVPLNAIGRAVHLGTKYNNLKLPEFVGVIGAQITCRALRDKLEIFINCNGQQKDISQAFELTYIANTASLTAQQSMSKALGLIANTASNIFQISAGGAGIVSGGVGLASTLTNLTQNESGQYKEGGNGLTTWEDVIKNNKGDCFYLTVNDGGSSGFQNFDMYQKVINDGATCEINIPEQDLAQANSLWQYLLNADYLLQPYTGQTQLPVILADLEVNGIPTAAADSIQAKFNEGVRLYIIGPDE